MPCTPRAPRAARILLAMRIRLLARRLVGLASLLGFVALLGAPAVLAAEVEITSTGPLTRVIISGDLNCQVAHREDDAFEFYPSGSTPGSCGTFFAVGGTLYGPASLPSGFFSALTPWMLVSQAPVAGSGSQGDPFRTVTTVEATGANLRLEQTDSYVVGSQSYRTDMRITNQGSVALNGILYRAGDCYLQESDVGFGRVDGGAPACVVSDAADSRIEQWLPITAGSHYIEAGYIDVFAAVDAQQQFPDTCTCDVALDNGAGLSWPVSLAAGQTLTVSHETFFSPVGRALAQQSYRDSVPDPTSISLDPIVVAQSVAIAAGVILLVPFPAALFNSALEENYEEVMAGVARVRGRLSRAWAAFKAWIRRQLAARRTSPASPPGGPPPVALAQPPGAVTPPAAATPAGPQVAPGPPAAPAVPAAPDLWRSPQGMAIFVLLSALLYAFLDPTFGISLVSLATVAGLTLGLFVVLLAYGLPLFLVAQRRRIVLSARALPATIFVAALCVIVSRVADFQPGYLYGLIIGFFFAHTVDRREEGRAEAIASAVSLLTAFAAWIALAFLRAGNGPGDELVGALLGAAMVTVVVAGLENAVFAMLPLRFLPGSAVFDWNRRVWIVLLGLGVFGFAHVLLNPTAGYLADNTRTSFLTMVALLLGFGLASVLFWAWFRFRPKRAVAG